MNAATEPSSSEDDDSSISRWCAVACSTTSRARARSAKTFSNSSTIASAVVRISSKGARSATSSWSSQ